MRIDADYSVATVAVTRFICPSAACGSLPSINDDIVHHTLCFVIVAMFRLDNVGKKYGTALGLLSPLN
ncbi:hypothetical protein CA13_32740 [Planctomycetes bacterium CA13]|uniref:Uncharacterized protein n=1 Tax=Novipirellula herctigrandis TaxID=2527986 RepID=A0A5C5Z4S8_9BACT|nr:hypothetical protein CA13_32740 [Planctomycetes bacterium CA13]